MNVVTPMSAAQTTRSSLKAVAVLAISAVVTCSATACNSDELTNAVCDVTAPLVEGIATALGAAVEVSPATAVLGGIAGVAVSDTCKHLFAQDTVPQSNGSFLMNDPLVPPSFRLPLDATICLPGDGKFGSVAAGTAVTTCQFSKNVRQAFIAEGNGTVRAFSPVTGVWYDMDCAGAYPVACTGGRNALVYIY